MTNFYFEFSAIGKADSKNWYLALFPYGIMKTTNIGVTWDSSYLGAYAINRLEFININIGFGIGKYSTFIKTTNAGQNWSIDYTHWPGQTWSMDFINENTGYAGGNTTRKTTNGGNSWEEVDFGQYYYSADIQFVNSNTGFIATQQITGTTSSAGIILKTTDSGNS
jgi:photosystem II stability/assembly factor-like uncharacterized protein